MIHYALNFHVLIPAFEFFCVISIDIKVDKLEVHINVQYLIQ